MEILKEHISTNLTDTKEVGIRLEDMSFVISYLTKGLYSNPLKSIIREYTSNCLDAIGYARKEEGVVIRLEKNNELTSSNSYLHFIDYGIGLSKDKLMDVYLKVGASDKREDNTMIGGFGLGSKSFASYSNSITVESVKDGLKNKVLIFKNDYGSLSYTFLADNIVTTEESGTKVSLPIKVSDIPKVQEYILSQLSYIPHIKYEGFPELFYTNLKSKLDIEKILDNVSIAKSQNYYTKTFELVIGGIAYELSSQNKLSSKYSLKYIIDLPIGKYRFTPSRETLEDSEELYSYVQDLVDATNLQIEKNIDNYFKNITSEELFDSIFTNNELPKLPHAYESLLRKEEVEILNINGKKVSFNHIKKVLNSISKSAHYSYFSNFSFEKLKYGGRTTNYCYPSNISGFNRDKSLPFNLFFKTNLDNGVSLLPYFRSLVLDENINNNISCVNLYNIGAITDLNDIKNTITSVVYNYSSSSFDDNELNTISEFILKLINKYLLDELEVLEKKYEPYKLERTVTKTRKVPKNQFKGTEIKWYKSNLTKQEYDLSELNDSEKPVYLVLDSDDYDKLENIKRYQSDYQILSSVFNENIIDELAIIIKPYTNQINKINLEDYPSIKQLKDISITQFPTIIDRIVKFRLGYSTKESELFKKFATFYSSIQSSVFSLLINNEYPEFYDTYTTGYLFNRRQDIARELKSVSKEINVYVSNLIHSQLSYQDYNKEQEDNIASKVELIKKVIENNEFITLSYNEIRNEFFNLKFQKP